MGTYGLQVRTTDDGSRVTMPENVVRFSVGGLFADDGLFLLRPTAGISVALRATRWRDDDD